MAVSLGVGNASGVPHGNRRETHHNQMRSSAVESDPGSATRDDLRRFAGVAGRIVLTGAHQDGIVDHRIPRGEKSGDSEGAGQEAPQGHLGALPATDDVEPAPCVTGIRRSPVS